MNMDPVEHDIQGYETARELTREQHDTLISINSFLEKAQEAYSQNDMSMAVNLAENAYTLSKEIVSSSKQQ